ncbi:MAG: TerB N-terminal domain-containing protein [Planctomycetes bacterium]|nr:TerB N-terminal domain-containing protein [Planctomycetota bacterium]
MASMEQPIPISTGEPHATVAGPFAGRIYRDQPLRFAAPPARSFTPPRIREMRQLARGGLYDARTFYRQAKFMEWYEDDCAFAGEFQEYFPTYGHMTDAQLRGYFTWRTGVRQGRVEKTSLSFAFVYAYELLHQIGVASPLEGFHTLRAFWLAYRELDPRLDNYLRSWLQDYVVYHDLDRALLVGVSTIAIDEAVLVLLDYRKHDPAAVFAALNSLSSYNMEKSRLYTRYPEEVRQVVYRVFAVVSEYYNRDPNRGTREKLFGRICASSYTMFKSAVFYDPAPAKDRCYQFSPHHRYLCIDNRWQCERFVWYGRNNKRIGALLKTIDYLLRQRRGMKSTLQPGKVNKVVWKKIEGVIAGYERERKAQPPAIVIDCGKLGAIRASAQATQERLLAADTAQPPPAATPALPPDPVAVQPADGLSEVEWQILGCLLAGGDGAQMARTHNIMLSVVLDAINEKLFDRFQDTVIDDTGAGGAAVRLEYREELKGMVPQ